MHKECQMLKTKTRYPLVSILPWKIDSGDIAASQGGLGLIIKGNALWLGPDLGPVFHPQVMAD